MPLDAEPAVPAPPPPRNLLHRWIIDPLLHLLKLGATPHQLAWALAVGITVGINPLLGATTVLSLGLAWALRLNLVASQIATHLMYPLQLALFFVFIRMGNRAFDTGRIPLKRHALLEAMRHHPIDTTRLLWTWEWHALVLWALCAVILTPLLAYALTPPLEHLLRRLHKDPDNTLPALIHDRANRTRAGRRQDKAARATRFCSTFDRSSVMTVICFFLSRFVCSSCPLSVPYNPLLVLPAFARLLPVLVLYALAVARPATPPSPAVSSGTPAPAPRFSPRPYRSNPAVQLPPPPVARR